MSVASACVQWDSRGDGTLELADVTMVLKALRLGLSEKEVAQIFNVVAASTALNQPPNGVSGGAHPDLLRDGRLVLDAFQAAVETHARQNKLKDWARAAFARIRHFLEQTAVDSAAKRHAEAPAYQHLRYSSFAALVNEGDPSMSSLDVGRLWCVLAKEDYAEDPMVDVEELYRWFADSLN